MKRVCSYAPALLLIVTLMFTGCAMKPKPYHDDPKNSYALNIMRAVGAKQIRDSKPDSATAQGPSVITMAAAGWAGSGSSSPASLGLGSMAGAGLNVLAFATAEKSMESMSFGFGWIPKGNERKEDVISRIKEQAEHALHETLAETTLPQGYSYTVNQKYPFMVEIDGPECGDKAACKYKFYVDQEMENSFAPETLGGGEAWRFTIIMNPASYAPKAMFSKEVPLFSDLQIYQRLSSKLPPNFFIYLAPSYASWMVSMQTEQGMRFLLAPVLLNKGEIHRFIAPSN